MIFRLLLTLVVVAAITAAAPAKPPTAIATRQLPPTVRAGLPKGAISFGGVRVGSHFLHWYRHAGEARRVNHLAIWRRAGGTWRLRRRVCLPEDSLSPQLDLESIADPVPTEWLRPRNEAGLILEFYEFDEGDSFYVFPQGLDGPVWVWSGGGGLSHNRTSYRLGPPDRRGFRVLEARSNWQVEDGDEVAEWKRYWTGRGWGRKGAERTYIEKL